MIQEVVHPIGRVRYSGNQAVACGALEAGVRVATGYPGAPISDLQGSFEEIAGNIPRTNPFTIRVGSALDKSRYQLAAHWGTTTNEDNAMAFALGSVMCRGDFKRSEFLSKEEWRLVYGDTIYGKDHVGRIPVGSRVMCSFKHLGGNTAADVIRVAVNIVPYSGGLGIASGDDRQGTASQTMQDNKVLFAFHFRIPTLELHSPRASATTVKNCYKLFEELGTPFAVVMNYDLAYREISGDLVMRIDMAANSRRKGFTRDPKHLVTIGPHIRPREHKFHRKLLPLYADKISENFELLGGRLSRYGSNPRTMLVLNGPFREDFQLIKQDSLLQERLQDKFGEVLAVETDVVFPQPRALIKELIAEHSIERIIVYEEGYGRVIYLQLLDMVQELAPASRVFDCSIPYEPRIYERFSYVDHILTE
ncbi:MAG: hypothetical protein JRJ12_11740 [Deltaproteobacteria bacterium]|nr:hypothetical protein [Deltaproteobacteria bacterium]